MTEDSIVSLLYLERRAHAETRRKLKKAEHDRERYARRIRVLQGNQEILSRELRSIRVERDILKHCVGTLERGLLDEPGRTQESGKSKEAE